MEEIIIKDTKIGLLFRNALLSYGNRNPKFGQVDFKRFTKDELSKIERLDIINGGISDISELEYCVNLRKLNISSPNAKFQNANYTDECKSNYEMNKNGIKDFSVIEKLSELEELSIKYEDGLEKLDVSNLNKLWYLDIENNSNLTEVCGLDQAEELTELRLFKNNILNSINLPHMMGNGRLLKAELDFDMYPAISRKYPDISEFLYQKQKNSIVCKWHENVSNIESNEMSTHDIEKMNKKANEILEEIIRPNYTDIEKISAIYAYIIENVKYDYDSLNARDGEKNQAYENARNDLSQPIEKILNKIQSSYNGFISGKCVCEGYSNMMHYLLSAEGIKSTTVGCSDNLELSVVGHNSNHRVIRAQIEGDWYYFDPTWDAQKLVLNNFFKTKEEFSKNHVLSMSEFAIGNPQVKAYSNEELTNIMKKVIDDKNNPQEFIDIKKLGKETQDIRNDDFAMGEVEEVIREHMDEKENSRDSFLERLRKYTQENPDMQNLIDDLKKDLDKELEEQDRQRKKQEYEEKVEKGDDDYIM